MRKAVSKPLEVLTALAQAHGGCRVEPEEWREIASGASGRYIARWKGNDASFIGIFWTPDRADNGSFPRAAETLRSGGVRVPSLLALQDCGGGCGACLVQDLGDECLLDRKGEPWPQLRELYRRAMREAARVHSLPAERGEQPPFDASLYRWEQEYCAEHFLACHVGRDPGGFADQAGLRRMAAFLASQPRVLVHRDLQSQNVMLAGGDAWLIDFQGMRGGLAEYDLASLAFDPYMDLSFDQRRELMALWEEIEGRPLDPEVFICCALQRILQALGAYANLWYRGRKAWYRQWIVPALRSLDHITRLPAGGAVSRDAIACLREEHILPAS